MDEEGRKGHVEETKWSFYLVKAYFYKVKAMLWGRKSYALTW